MKIAKKDVKKESKKARVEEVTIKGREFVKVYSADKLVAMFTKQEYDLRKTK